MTDEELKIRAREYALKNCDALVPAGRIDFIANDFIEHLSKDYAIVPKSKVRGEYTDAVAEGNHAHVKHQIQSRTRLRTLESIFGKDMFEEEGK